MTLVLLMLLVYLLTPSMSFDIGKITEHATAFHKSFPSQGGIRTLLPIYIRLQALQKGSVILWESVPQNFSDYVGTINLNVLAIFVSFNALSLNLSRDVVGNLWMVANYTFEEGDYISTLMWVSSEAIIKNTSVPEVVPFPQNYTEEVKPFLDSGRKMPVENETIQAIAQAQKNPQNMVETVRNVLNFVNQTQEYDSEKTRLLMSSNLNTTNILDFLKDPLEVLETNSSLCYERSVYAAAILRAADVPTRTFTCARLKTWIQVWLPNYGWVDAEAECARQREKAHIFFPRPLYATPWVIENSSDATFPFQWLPEVPMRLANLTFGIPEAFNVNEYRTVLSQPIDAEVFRDYPNEFSFPLISQPEMRAAVTQKGSNLTFSLFKGAENVSKPLTLGETNSVALGDMAVSFNPVRLNDFLALEDFVVQPTWTFDVRIMIPIVGVPIVLLVWFYWKRRRR